MEVVKQMRSELAARIEPLRSKVEIAGVAVLFAREEIKSLNERLTPVAASVMELLLKIKRRCLSELGNFNLGHQRWI